MLGGEAQTHAPHLDLLPTDDRGDAPMATHVAVRDGDWFDPRTWAGGAVPGAGALVHIPADVAVEYQGASNANLFIVRVDGELTFGAERGVATKMVVDTIVTAPGSTFRVDAAAPTDGTVDIVFDEGRPAAHRGHYTDLTAGDGVIGRYEWDPEQLSLGLVAGGTVEVHGQEVESGLKMARGAVSGATRMTLDAPDGDPGWQVGQKIVVGGMNYRGTAPDGSLAAEDEVREIVAVRYASDRLIVEFDRPLEFDHRGPDDPATGKEIAGYVGNLGRNVTFASAVADRDGDGLADRGLPLGADKGPLDHVVTERGHVMFMHNDDVGVTNAAFFGLGRTDKSRPVDDYRTAGDGDHRLHTDGGTQGAYDPGADTEIETPAAEITNQRGRYALHIHQAGDGGHHEAGDHAHAGTEHEATGGDGPCPMTGEAVCHCADQDGDGIENCADDDYFDGAYLAGNVVWGSPGWGVVQHDSRAALDGNLVFDVAGSAFVAELGSETGRWQGNLAIGTYGAGERPNGDDASDFNEDSGFAGVGFYMKSRALEVLDNVAHSSARAAFYYHNHGIEFAPTATDRLGDELAGLGDGQEAISTEDVPIRVFDGNAAFAAQQGIRIVTDPLDAVRKFNDAWSHLKNFTAVDMDESGVSLTYSSKYVFENFTIVGTGQKVGEMAQLANAGFFFKASAADLTVLGGHVSGFQNAVTNWSMIGDRQEYRRGYWDPKGATSDQPDVPRYQGMGAVEGIDNPAWNLWNTAVVGLGTSEIDGVRWRLPGMEVEVAPGVTKQLSGGLVLGSAAKAPNPPGVDIELLGDSRNGALVALWRESAAARAGETPLAYQETAYLSQIWFADGDVARRRDFTETPSGLTADIWSGTALEFAKTDGLGRQVFLYGDFSPLHPAKAELTATTNEKILFTREMIDGVLARDGYMRLGGVDDVRFVVMRMVFTDRLTGEIETKKFLVALDRAWKLPEGVRDSGLLLVTDDLIVAPQYRVFENGAPVAGRAPIVVGDAPAGSESASAIWETGLYTTDRGDALAMGAAADKVRGGEGADLVVTAGGNDSVDGGGGDDLLDGGTGADRLDGGAGGDLLDGGTGNDRLDGGDGHDLLAGGDGGDVLTGGAGNDVLRGGGGNAAEDAAGAAAARLVTDTAGHESAPEAAEAPAPTPAPAPAPTPAPAPAPTPAPAPAPAPAPTPSPTPAPAPAPAPAATADSAGATSVPEPVAISGVRLDGTAGADTLTGGARDDAIDGLAGDDHLSGAGGRDALRGGAGSDDLRGGADDDELDGGDDADWLFGNQGTDRLAGQAGADRLAGGWGDDRMQGDGGADRLEGNYGNDVLDGGDENDWVSGGGDDDRLIGGAGADSLNGDAGRDRFVFDTSSGSDIITDFEDGVDSIEFLIESFGFADLDLVQQSTDVVVGYRGGTVRLLDTDLGDMDATDFHFLPTG